MDPRFGRDRANARARARAPPPPPPLPHRAPPPPPPPPHPANDDANVEIDVDALRSMPKDERRALARIAKALLSAEDEETKIELAAELQKRCARAANAAANGTATPNAGREDDDARRRDEDSNATGTSAMARAGARFGDWTASREDAETPRTKKRKTTTSETASGTVPSSTERAARMDRAQRFAREAIQFASDVANAKGRGTPTMQEMKMRDAAAVGTNTALEKTYLRLTEAPSMATVRPPHVLERALELVKSKWVAHKDYEGYAKDQLKSIRQDLTVQHIRDGDLVLQTYQTHARIALECGDLAEYNQCQAVLKVLHAELLERTFGVDHPSPSKKGKKSASKKSSGKKRSSSERDEDTDRFPEGTDDIAEFAAYRLIYAAGAGSKGERSAALLRELRDIPPRLRTHPFLEHAVRVCRALASSNFHRFFALYDTVPRMGAYLMDIIAPSVRTDAVRAVLRAYAPTVPVEFVASALGFSSSASCADALAERHRAVFDGAARDRLDVRATNAAIAADAVRPSVLDRLARF